MKKTIRKAAAIDVGTNSVQLLVGDLDVKGHLNVLMDQSANVRLGKNVGENGELLADAITDAMTTINQYIENANALGASRIRLVGTSAVRDASNKEKLLSLIHNESGLELEPISPYDEGRLAYLAQFCDPEFGSYEDMQVVADVGGGSTELIYGSKDNVISVSSVKAGAVRLSDRFLKGDETSFCQLVDLAIMAERFLMGLANGFGVGRVIAVGGSAVNLARVWQEVPINETEKIHGLAMSFRDLRLVMDMFFGLNRMQRLELTGLEPERVDSILAGAIIFERILSLLNIEQMIVSARGLRHGVLYEMLAS